MRKALFVGINYYDSNSSEDNCLSSCVLDAMMMESVLRRNGDASRNFDTRCILAKNSKTAVSAAELQSAVEVLFSGDPEVALFYYSGHGSVDAYGGYLCPSDYPVTGVGLSLDILMKIVAGSKAKNKIIILDSCFSGSAGVTSTVPNRLDDFCYLPENTVVLAACRKDETAREFVFTPLLRDALTGGAMNILGEVSPGSLYSYVDRSLDAWKQRPVFKANIQNFVCLRKNIPPITLAELHRLTELFSDPEMKYQLDPTYEPDKHETDNKLVDKDHEEIMELFRKYNSLNLLKPEGTEYLYWAALESKHCVLTALGRHYWQLVEDDLI